MRCSAYFETVDKLREAYSNLINGVHKGYIIKIKPELDTDMLKITLNMGVEAKTQARKFLPLIGEVQLRFGIPTTKETVNQILKEL